MPEPYYERPDQPLPEGGMPGSRTEAVAVSAAWAGLMMMLFGCCCNVYMLIIGIVADVVAIVAALLSRQENGGTFPGRTKNAVVMAGAALAGSFVMAYFYHRAINNEALMNQVYQMLQDMNAGMPSGERRSNC